LISIIIPTSKSSVLTFESLKECPVPYQLVTSSYKGVGKARHYGVCAAKNDLVVMFDDDLIVKPEIWKHILKLKQTEFILTHVGEHLSTRVFAIHKMPYLEIGGFDTNIKYIFEDGEFAIRAKTFGLTLKVLSHDFIIHKDHKMRSCFGPFGLNLPFWFEWTKMYVKYGKFFSKDLFMPFQIRHDYRVAFQWWIIKTSLVFFSVLQAVIERWKAFGHTPYMTKIDSEVIF
jgi:hypothetical protein